MPDVPIRSFTDSRQAHLDDHNLYRLIANSAVYSSAFGTLQSAIDEAAFLKRPLIVAPKSYTLNTPLLMNGLSDVHVFAHGATFIAGVDMPALLDMRDCTRCSWHGGWFKVPTGRIVPNAIYVYRDVGQATRNIFQDVTIEGDYGAGIRIGKQGSGAQCDHIWFTNVECIGRSLPGQVGVYVGDGVFGNCLNHTFNNLMCSAHETHVKVDATNAYITNAFFDTAVTDLYINSNTFSIRNVRSEDSQRFMVTGGLAGYCANITIEDVLWNGQQIAADGEWIQHKLAGYLKLSQVKVVNAAHTPIIRAGALAPLRIAVDGLTMDTTPESAFVVTPQTSVRGNYVQNSPQGVVSITTL